MRWWVWMVAVALVVAASQPAHGAGSEVSVSWLATGDSYSSGEGIAGSGVNDSCARSELAYAPLAANVLEQQRDWTIAPFVFSACTGALATEMFNARHGSPSLWARSRELGAPRSGRFDVITLSFGGNDLGFADGLVDCLAIPDSWTDFSGLFEPDGCDELPTEDDIGALLHDPSWTSGRHTVGGQPTGVLPTGRAGSLRELYAHLIENHLTDRGVLVVLGYPRLLAPSGSWGAWRGNWCQLISASDADTLGSLVEHMDREMAASLEAVDPVGDRSIYLSRLDLFDDNGRFHSPCSANRIEWLNGLTLGLGDGSGRHQHSFHPNAIGHAATAEALANLLDGRFDSLAPSTTIGATTAPPTTQPPVQVDKWEIGAPFAARCTVAWPTAPVYTSDSIQMRMSCIGVPGQFLFVDVWYGDPDLPITPMTGAVIVRGTIYDVAESGYGFRTLVVVADDVEFE